MPGIIQNSWSSPSRAHVVVLLGGLMASFFLSGCLRQAIEPAIDEIEQLRRDVNATAAKGIDSVDKWREEAAAWRNGKGRFADAAASFMQEAIPEAEAAAQRTVAEAREQMAALAMDTAAEAKLTVDYTDARIRAHFQALRKAIEELQKVDRPIVERFKDSLRELATKQEVEPKTAISQPRKLEVIWTTPNKTGDFAISHGTVEISGFGFLQDSVKKKLAAQLIQGNGNTRSLPLKINSDFLLTVEVPHESLKGSQADELQLLCDARRLHTVPLHWYRQPLQGPPGGRATIVFAPDGKTIQSISPAQAAYGIVPSSAHLIRADGSQDAIPLAESIDLNNLGLLPGDSRIELFWNQDDIHEAGKKRVLTIASETAQPAERVVSSVGSIMTTDQDREGAFCILKLRDGPQELWSHTYPEKPVWNDHTSVDANFAVDAALPANPVLEVILSQEGAEERNILWRFSCNVVFQTSRGRSISFGAANQRLNCGDGNPATVSISIIGTVR